MHLYYWVTQFNTTIARLLSGTMQDSWCCQLCRQARLRARSGQMVWERRFTAIDQSRGSQLAQ